MSADASSSQPSEDTANVFLRNSAIAGVIVTPILMALPPRKIDLRFTVLAGTFLLSTNHLTGVYSGETLQERWSRRLASTFGPLNQLPPDAEKTRQILKEYREREAAMKLHQQHQASAAAAAAGETGLAKKVEDVWMGGEDKDWQKKRAEEHQKQFDEGKGMGSIIMEQISDVWSGNWRPSSKKDTQEASSASDDKTTTTPEKKA